ncbi:MAG: hypothetical protein DRP45_06565 [Candidatus Zixiibacteriota bacterium]|nr:MAG: hypothetical protein DRP45_06565 [candidate division Zixibacteria bacterium]
MNTVFSRSNLRLLLIFQVAILFGIAGTSVGTDVFSLGADIPEQDEPQLVGLSAVFSTSSAEAGKSYVAAAVVSIASDWHINSAKPYQDYLIPANLSVDTVGGLIPYSITYPRAGDAVLADEVTSVYHGEVAISFQVKVAEDVADGEYTIPISFTSQSCNDVSCLPPQTIEAQLEVTIGHEGTPINEEIFGALDVPIDQGQATGKSGELDSDLQRLIDEYGFWGYLMALGVAFVMGLLLSFSPCTYPMIPITVSIFAGQQRSVGKGFVMSLFYVGSMAVVYGLMGLVVSLVGGVFGAWLANPIVVVSIAVVFVIFSLSMFGLYELQVPLFIRQKLGTTRKSGGVVGAIVLGIVAALVVSPCVGPFVAGILMYVATSGSPYFGFLILFVFALGLGTLFMIIGTFSSAINKLPNSGAWMETVKKFFGFVLLLMALYFVRTVISPVTTAILTALVLLAFGVFGGGIDRISMEAGFFVRLKKYLGIIALLTGTYLFVGTVLTEGFILPPVSQWFPTGTSVSAHNSELIKWETDLEKGLARAKAEGKPVLIDTWATWCINCRVLDKKTFGDPDVATEAERFVTIKIQLETADSPTTLDFKERFGLSQYSLPTTLLLDSQGRVQRMLQGVVKPETMIAEMRQLQ